MTDLTDGLLTRGRIEELAEKWHDWLVMDEEVLIYEVYDEVSALIDMARRTSIAERQRDILMAFVERLADYEGDDNLGYLSCPGTPFCKRSDDHSPGCAVHEAKVALAAAREVEGQG